jgi:hypothetical protein
VEEAVRATATAAGEAADQQQDQQQQDEGRRRLQQELLMDDGDAASAQPWLEADTLLAAAGLSGEEWAAVSGEGLQQCSVCWWPGMSGRLFDAHN